MAKKKTSRQSPPEGRTSDSRTAREAKLTPADPHGTQRAGSAGPEAVRRYLAEFFAYWGIPQTAQREIKERAWKAPGGTFRDLERECNQWLADHGRTPLKTLDERVSEHLYRLKMMDAVNRATWDAASAPPKSDESDGPWSEPDTPARWAIKFKVKPRTFKRWVKAGKIKAKILSDRSYQIHLAALPQSKAGPAK